MRYIFTFVVSVTLATFSQSARAGEQEEAIIKQIPTLGGSAEISVSVDLSNTKVKDEDLKCLAGLNTLRSLNLDQTAITDAGLANLKSLPKLQELHLRGTRITDAGLACLGNMTQLEVLDLTGTRISDAGLANMSQLRQLRSLDLTSVKIKGTGLVYLKGLNRLTYLNLLFSTVGDAGMGHVRELTTLREITLSGEITDKGLLLLKDMPALRSISFGFTSRVNERTAADFRKAAPRVEVGSPIEWGESFAEREKALAVKRQETHQQAINKLRSESPTDMPVDEKTPGSPVTWVSFYGKYLGRQGATKLAPLKDLPELRRLDLCATFVDDAALTNLENLTELRELDLSNTWVTDAGLKHLEKLMNLRTLDLRQTKVTDAGVAELRKALPGVSISR
jgi:internalin A